MLLDKLDKKYNLTQLVVTKRWALHILFWLVYFLVSLPGYIQVLIKEIDYFPLLVLSDVTNIFLAYFLILVLYPSFFAKHKYLSYIFSIFLAVAIFSAIFSFIIKTNFNSAKLSKDYTYLETVISEIPWFVFFSLLITMCKTCKDFFIRQHIENERKQQQTKEELNNLKAQLSPHFLFNTMNNFYGLAVSQSKQLPDLMLRMSDLMRYSLYGTNSPFVLLSDELNYLRNYIELERIRLEDSLKLEFKTDIDETKNYSIAPLLLIVFVENAFKHSKKNKDGLMDIRINIVSNLKNEIWFSIRNYYAPMFETEARTDGGIGLVNVKKRLEVIYPDTNHHLNVSRTGDNFCVELKLKLNPL